jgi:hypothetical protein
MAPRTSKRKSVKSRRKSRVSRMMKNTKKFSFLGDEASAYYPGSEKPRYALVKSRLSSRKTIKSIRPKVNLKGGFTRGQVRLYRKTGSTGIGPLRKNKLGQFGYKTTLPEGIRHKSLDKAVKKYGDLSIYRSLNAIAVYNKNTHPETSSIARSDRDFIKDKYFE